MSKPLRLITVTQPAIEPINGGEAKVHAKVDDSVDAAYLSTLISTARHMAEQFTRKAFINRSMKVFFDCWPAGDPGWWDGMREGSIVASQAEYVSIPFGPLVSITHVKTYDDADNATTWPSAQYFADVATQPGRIVKRTGYSWPTFTRPANGIEIQFIAGFGANASDVPPPIRQAILMTVAYLYEHRGDAVVEMPGISKQLLMPYKEARL